MKSFRMMLFVLGLVAFVGGGRHMVSAQSRLDDKDVQHILENLSSDAKSFRSTFEQALKQSSIRKTSRQKDAEQLAMTFQRQTAGIIDQFKHTKNVPGLQEVSATASQIENLISELQLNGETTVKWQKIKPELAQVQSAFGLSPTPTAAGSSNARSSPTVNPSAICSINWGDIETDTNPIAGESPISVSLRNDGYYIQAYESSGGTKGAISFIVGLVLYNENRVMITAPQQHDTGFYPSVSMNNAGVIMTVHVDRSSGVGNPALFYQFGWIDPKQGYSQSIHWTLKAYQYDNGWNPQIAINDKMQMIEVHQSSRVGSNALLYRVGTFSSNGSTENNYYPFWNNKNGIEYDKGATPNVSLDNDGNVIEVHQEINTGNLHYRRGHISGNTVTWESAASNGRYITGPMGVGKPKVALNDNGAVVEVHDSQGLNVYTSTGQLDSNASNNVNLSGNNFLQAGAFPTVSSNSNKVLLMDRVSPNRAMRSRVGTFSCPTQSSPTQ